MSRNARFTPVRQRPSGRRRWWVRIGLALGVLVALVCVIYGVILVRASGKIREEMTAIKEANEPLNWDELARTDRQGRVQPAGENPGLGETSRLYAEALPKTALWERGEGQKLYDVLRAGAIGDDQIKTLGAAIENYVEVLDQLRQAAEHSGISMLPQSASDLHQRLRDQSKQLALQRSGARLLAARALYAAATGRGDEAAEWCVVLCRLVRAFPGDNMVSGLVRIAKCAVACNTIERTYGLAFPSAKATSELIAAVADLQDETPLARIMCGERVVGSSLFMTGPAATKARVKLFMRTNYAYYLGLVRRTISAARRPFPASIRQMEALAGECAKDSPIHALVRNLMPALTAAFHKAAMDQARVRVTLTTLAIRRARMDTKALPSSLEELAPTYLKQVPLDPFTGQPLRYRLEDGQCFVYSVGLDRVDNGGTGELLTGSEPGIDIVIRIPR